MIRKIVTVKQMDQCETAATWLPVHVLRRAGGCVTGLPGLPVGVAGLLEGQLKHFLESVEALRGKISKIRVHNLYLLLKSRNKM